MKTQENAMFPGQTGLTLVELVVVIVLVGILAVVGANIIGNFVGGYTESASRGRLAGIGRVAIERMARELRQAVPNTVCVGDCSLSSGSKITFLDASSAGFYIPDTVGGLASDEVVDFGRMGDVFAAYGMVGVQESHQVLVYPLNPAPTADSLRVYGPIANNSSVSRARVDNPGTNSWKKRQLTLKAQDQISPTARGSFPPRVFSSGWMESFCFDQGQIKYHKISLESLPSDFRPADIDCRNQGVPLAESVDQAEFVYRDERNLVTVYMRLKDFSAQEPEVVDFQERIHVRNLP